MFLHYLWPSFPAGFCMKDVGLIVERNHLLIPIYKKYSVYAAINYRGIHLTTILSKVVERTIGNPLISHLQSHGFGDHQWAFGKMSSARIFLLHASLHGSSLFAKAAKLACIWAISLLLSTESSKISSWPNSSAQGLLIFFWIF